MTRARLLNRRSSESVDFTFDGMAWTASFTRYRDGRLAELFLTGPKSGTGLMILAHDAAIAVSIGLQHGVDAATLRSALLRSPNGAAASVVAHALDLVEGANG